jgi:arginase
VRTIRRVSRRIGVIGVPTSAGAFAPGQEAAPQALRAAGLVKRLQEHGLEVQDHGERAAWFQDSGNLLGTVRLAAANREFAAGAALP